MKESLHGIIETITFHNPDNGFAVLRVQGPGNRTTTVVGPIVRPIIGEYITATGEWVQHAEFGTQFKAEEMHTTPPHTEEGIRKYLGSGLVKGIGPHFAKKIVDVFGERTLQVIDESPTYLSEIRGIGSKRIQRIRDSWREQKAVRDIMIFLQSHGIGTARAVRIYKTYGDSALDKVQANPYRLATEVWGFGFDTTDQLARNIGIDPHSPLRASAALRYVLQQQSNNDGDCGYPEPLLLQKTQDMTGIPQDILTEAMEALRTEGELIREPFDGLEGAEPWLYLKPLFLAELGVARSILALLDGPHPLPEVDTEAALNWIEQRMNLTLADSQRQAIQLAATEKVLVITGGPGVGKTTIVRGILDMFTAKNLRCGLCAPTGRAAKRLSETTGAPAKTIHRLLEFDPAFGGFKRDRDRSLEVDLLIVDEASMVDIVLMNQLLRAVPSWASVVFVGDVDQLPSVGPGRVLADIINSGVVPVARLNEIFRQAGESRIIQAAHRINQGHMPETSTGEELSDFYIIEASTPDVIIDRILMMIRDRIPKRFGLDPFRDVQVLTPMTRSELGAPNLNRRLQTVLNPASANKPETERFSTIFRVGDKVIQTKNNYTKETFNGDIGRIIGMDLHEQELVIDYDGREVHYEFSELDELGLAYALTIHKSQGSEYPAVILPLHTQHYMMLRRNLLYTGITRGKKLVVLTGTRKAIRKAVQTADSQERHTALGWRMK